MRSQTNIWRNRGLLLFFEQESQTSIDFGFASLALKCRNFNDFECKDFENSYMFDMEKCSMKTEKQRIMNPALYLNGFAHSQVKFLFYCYKS